VHALTHTPASPEDKMIAFRRVRIVRSFSSCLEVILVPIRVEVTWIRMTFWIHMYVPDIAHNACTLWNLVTHILVIFNDSMRDSENVGGHPTQTLFATTADVR
jgi:hypothetical protein